MVTTNTTIHISKKVSITRFWIYRITAHAINTPIFRYPYPPSHRLERSKFILYQINIVFSPISLFSLTHPQIHPEISPNLYLSPTTTIMLNGCIIQCIGISLYRYLFPLCTQWHCFFSFVLPIGYILHLYPIPCLPTNKKGKVTTTTTQGA